MYSWHSNENKQQTPVVLKINAAFTLNGFDDQEHNLSKTTYIQLTLCVNEQYVDEL